MPQIDGGDTAWVLASTALVLLMAPGLALFYGGMVRAKSILNMMMMTVSSIVILTVVWLAYGYSLAFTTDEKSGLIGGLDAVGMSGVITTASGTIPTPVFATFQLTFAIITTALVSGAIAERAKFSAWCVFCFLWATFVYVPIAHWVFFFDGGKGGWIGDRLGALDFAGGTAVEINSGAAGLAMALVLGRRLGWRRDPMRPHNLPFVMLGAGLLWFGWFGFNAGSALAANMQAGMVLANTQIAASCAIVGWLVVERIRDGSLTTFGAASGAVAGLVAITPSCASVTPLGAAGVGVVAGMACSAAVALKYRLGYDDSLDVVGVHLVGGLVGTLMIGLLASAEATGILTEDKNDGVNGLFYGGGADQLGRQAIAAGAVLAYSFVVTLLLGLLVHKTMGFRVTPEDEITGLDLTEHAETAYELGPATSHPARMPVSSGSTPPGSSGSPAPPT
jgi:Amt family ammonium transporter